MADAQGLQPTSPTGGMPVNFTSPTQSGGTVNPVPVQTPAATEPAPQAQTTQRQDSFYSGDPNTLPPELRKVYDQLQGDYTRKRMSESEELKKAQARAKEYDDLRQRYDTDRRNWEGWRPYMETVSKLRQDPQVYGQVQQLLSRDPRAQQQAQPQQSQTAQQQVERYLQGLADDDYLTPAHFEQGIGRFRDQFRAQLQQEVNAYLRQQIEALAQQMGTVMQNYQTLYDQAQDLKLQKLYGLKAPENNDFNLEEVIRTAVEMRLPDLNAAYTLRYGEAEARRLAEAQAMAQQKTREQLEQEAYQRGLQEGRLAGHNAASGFVPTPPNLPKFEAKKVPNSYGEAEKQLAEKLAALGMRSGA